MCCTTHAERDRRDPGYPDALKPHPDGLYAELPELRCQCSFGSPCYRRVTEEDMVCDWCRGADHMQWCFENMPGTSMGTPTKYPSTDTLAKMKRELGYG